MSSCHRDDCRCTHVHTTQHNECSIFLFFSIFFFNKIPSFSILFHLSICFSFSLLLLFSLLFPLHHLFLRFLFFSLLLFSSFLRFSSFFFSSSPLLSFFFLPFSGRACLMFVVKLPRMMNAMQWSRPETSVNIQPTCCHTVTFATRSLFRRSVVPAKFPLGTSARCLQNVRHQTRWLWCGLGTKHAMDHGT